MKNLFPGAVIVLFVAVLNAAGEQESFPDPDRPATTIEIQRDSVTEMRSCRSSSDCLQGEHCLNGQCRIGGGAVCLGDVDCPIGERCVSGRCRP